MRKLKCSYCRSNIVLFGLNFSPIYLSKVNFFVSNRISLNQFGLFFCNINYSVFHTYFSYLIRTKSGIPFKLGACP